MTRDPGRQLAALGWRLIEPISPDHGRRAMPGFHGGEPFFALASTALLDLIAGQAIATAPLTARAHGRFGGRVAVGGLSMSSFVAQQVAGRCRLWPVEARLDAVLSITPSGRIEDVTFGGELAASLGIDRAMRAAGRSRAALARLSTAIDPAEAPALAPSGIVSVLGEMDRRVPYGDGWRWRSDGSCRRPTSSVIRLVLSACRCSARAIRRRSSASGRCCARRREAGDLADQLAAHGAAEMVEVLG